MTDNEAIEELQTYLSPDSITGISCDCAWHSLRAIEKLALMQKVMFRWLYEEENVIADRRILDALADVFETNEAILRREHDGKFR
jgi:hypothetical protein